MKTPLSRRSQRTLLALACGSLAAAPLHAGGGTTGITERVSAMGDGSPVSENCTNPVISADGRYVAFDTDEPLLPEDDNNRHDVYVQDRETGTLVCASTNYWGNYVDGDSRYPSISADGRKVAFQTTGSIVGFDLNGTTDVVFIDLDEGIPRLVSGSNAGPATANNTSSTPSLSADGRYVAFQSAADNLIPGTDTNGTWDIYVHDMLLNDMRRASMGVFGEPNGASYRPSISGDGLRVAFHSNANNIVLWDNNSAQDVFLHDFTGGGSTQLISRALDGTPGDGSSHQAEISANGATIVFLSEATDLVAGDANGTTDAFFVNVGLDQVHLVSSSLAGLPANGSASQVAISPDGRYAAFRSTATDMTTATSGSADVYLRDLEIGETWLISRPSGASDVADQDSGRPSVSEDGLHVAFQSDAANLIATDVNTVRDIFVRATLADPVAYCDTMITVDGCEPSVTTTGIPSASANSGFNIIAGNVAPDKPCLLFYGFQGRKSLPFMGGTHCVKGATKRSRILRSVALGAGPCDGAVVFDMNAFAAGAIPGNPQPALSLVGQQVNAQFWGRDPGSPFGVFLTNAIEYMVGP